MNPGDRLGPYEIKEPLGAGGMGEVHRARDPRLDRDVAIKVLPGDFAADPERVARFEREAKLLAQLNHANIAGIYGLEDATGVLFIAMECVEGETLADRLAASGRLDIDEALDIARQVAEALEAAHEAGIVHRDLKPANVKITPGGAVKVLDFGLAKAWDAGSSAGASAGLGGEPPPGGVSQDLSQSPTMLGATRTGVILGTAAYMSPEQARGKPVDKRADIWAFGCVLYEMLAGKRAFTGETISDTLAAILKEEADWQALPLDESSPAHRLLRRCLVKDPRQRLRDIGDARIELADALHPAGSSAAASPGERPRERAASRIMGYLPWLLAVTGFVAAAALWAAGGRGSGPIAEGVAIRSTIMLPEEAPLAPQSSFYLAAPRMALALSHDAGTLAYVALTGGTERELWLRDMSSGTFRALPGTLDAHGPFFSPYGDEIGFFAEGKLKAVALGSGDVRTIADAVQGYGGAWAADGTIYFVPTEGIGIHRVPQRGGTLETLTRPAGEVFGHIWPSLLPDGAGILFSGLTAQTTSVFRVGTGNAETLRLVVTPGGGAHYAPPGNLLFGDSGRLLAARYELAGREPAGAPTVLLTDVATAAGVSQVTFADNGTMVYAPGGAHELARPVWVDRTGTPEALDLPVGLYGSFALSPDGTRLAYPLRDGDRSEIWLKEVGGGPPRILTRDAVDDFVTWDPTGESLYFNRSTAGGWSLMNTAISASGRGEQELVPAEEMIDGVTVTDDGWIYNMQARDIYFAPFANDGRSVDLSRRRELAADPVAQELFVDLSPDGRWLTYTSDERGLWDVYVVRYPELTDKQRVSVSGGEESRWSSDGSAVVYRFGNTFYSANFDETATPMLEAPAAVFSGPYINVGGYSWDMTPDGARFLVLENPDIGAPINELVVITGFYGEVERRLTESSQR